MNVQRTRGASRSGLLVIELLIATAVFSLCAAICTGLFVRADAVSRESAALNRAVAAAQNAAECFKAAGGDPARTAALSGGVAAADGAVVLGYDDAWALTDDTPVYTVTVRPETADGFRRASVTVADTKQTLYALPAAALEGVA